MANLFPTLILGVFLVLDGSSLWTYGIKDLRQGPSFLIEPSSRLDFYNSTGGILRCTATGNPKPKVTWAKQDGSVISDIPGLRHVRPDGSLVFPPFSDEEYRQDVHGSTYRCVATNSVGRIGSREVRVRGIIFQRYEIQSQDEFAIQGNPALLTCYIPPFVRDHVNVTSWQREDGLLIPSGTTHGKYRVTTDGSLLILNVDPSDSRWRYRCSTRDSLNGETTVSNSWGRLVVTESSSKLPPKIRSTKHNLKYQEGQDIEILCIAEGDPSPAYQWLKQEGEHLVPVTRNSRARISNGILIIFKATVRDAGMYVCQVNNSLGEDRKRFLIDVTEPLRVTIRPSIVRTKEGSSVTFNCSVRGHPLTSMEWFKDLSPLMFNTKATLLTRGILEISPVQREDKGMYQCFVKGADESATGVAQLILEEEPPQLKEVFSDQILSPGFRASLKCSVVGSPLPQVTWYRYSRPLLETSSLRIGDFVDSGSVLTSFVNVSSVVVEDGGVYSCQAKNSVGTSRHSAKLFVFGPPLVHIMDNITVVVAGQVQLDCAVAGYPIESISWKKGGNIISPSQRVREYANGTLVLLDISESDEGWYHCEVRGKQGGVASGSLFVDVAEKPVINPFLFGNDLREGMRTMVMCSISTGEPPIQIEWLKNGRPLRTIHPDVEIGSLGPFSSSLTISSILRQHAGNYTCKATSGLVSSNYTVGMVVHASPKWKVQPTSISAVMGERVVFDCQADGIPDPVHRWKRMKGGIRKPTSASDFEGIVSGPHMHVLENGSLVITEATHADEGVYLCEANNGVGSPISTSVELQVHLPAHFKQNFHHIEVRSQEHTMLTCEAFGDPPLSIIWTRNRQKIDFNAMPRYTFQEEPIAGGIRSQVSITSLRKGDSAFFTCTANNSYGRDERNIHLVVQAPPDPPRNVVISLIESRRVGLSWSEPPNGNSPITGYQVQYIHSNEPWESMHAIRSVSSRESTVIIPDLSPGSHYRFRVLAENIIGHSPPTSDVTVTTEEEAPSFIPVNVHALATSSKSITVAWETPPTDSVVGSFQGYYVGYKEAGSDEPYNYKTIDLTDDSRQHELHIENLRRFTKYMVTVQAFNAKGAGPTTNELIVQTMEYDPPLSPRPRVVSTLPNRIVLEWTKNDMENPVTGFIIHYKSRFSTVQEERVGAQDQRHILDNLRCGTSYQVTMTAYNNAGRGDPSDVVTTATTGTVPVPPDRQSLISVNSSVALLHLNAWGDGGCPILFFVVQYKPQLQREWILLSNNIVPEQTSVPITDLVPGTWYDLLMAAHNEAGSTEAEYQFATLTITGATVPPLSVSGGGSLSLLHDPVVLVPIACAGVVVLVIAVVVFVVLALRRRDPSSDCRSQGNYSGSSGGKGENVSMTSFGKSKGCELGDDPQRESLYYPSPYATSHVLAHGEDSMNPQSSTFRGPSSRGRDHIYDIPHRHLQTGEYPSYARLWTQSRSGLSYVSDRESEHETDTLGRARSSQVTKLQPSRCGMSVDDFDMDRRFTALLETQEGEEFSETECDRDHNYSSARRAACNAWTYDVYLKAPDLILHQGSSNFILLTTLQIAISKYIEQQKGKSWGQLYYFADEVLVEENQYQQWEAAATALTRGNE